jgi:subtilisin family serine protease
MRRLGVIGSVLLAALLAAGPSSGAEKGAATGPLEARGADAEFVAGELIVQFRPGVSSAARRDALGTARVADALGTPGLTLVRLPEGASVRASAAALLRDPRVAFAEPNYVRHLSQTIPDDPRFGELWGLSQPSGADISATDAWDTTTGSPNVVVAVIDSGVAYDHPDLAGNMWTHPTLPGVHGRDTVDEDNEPLDFNGHGTHVAGTIGAIGNNTIGVTGVNWDVSIMAVRAADADGSLADADINQALNYACANGAHVVNGSFGGPGRSVIQANILKSAACRNTLFVFAAGNDNANLTGDTVAAQSYPCEYHRAPPQGASVPNLICVGATTHTDARSPFSNRGTAAVHLGAPGGTGNGIAPDILSTWPEYGGPLPGFPESFENPGFTTRWGDQLGPGSIDWGQGAPFTSGAASLSDSPLDYVSNSDRSIRNLTAIDATGLRGCRADYNLRLDTEFGRDFLDVYALSSTGAPSFLDDLAGSWTGSTDGNFFALSTDISAIDDSATGYVRFSLFSDDSIEGDGAQIDDLIVSCLEPGGEEYEEIPGTSMATPHVAGVAALLLAATPTLTPAKLKNDILKGVDKKAALATHFSTGGRLNADRSVDLALDVTPPNTIIFGRPPASTTSRRATFRFRSTEAGSTFQCRHMNGAWMSCTSPKLYTGLTLGLHTFRVRAIDRALNVDPTPAMDTWRIRR